MLGRDREANSGKGRSRLVTAVLCLVDPAFSFFLARNEAARAE